MICRIHFKILVSFLLYLLIYFHIYNSLMLCHQLAAMLNTLRHYKSHLLYLYGNVDTFPGRLFKKKETKLAFTSFHKVMVTDWKFGRMRKPVETQNIGKCFHSFSCSPKFLLGYHNFMATQKAFRFLFLKYTLCTLGLLRF